MDAINQFITLENDALLEQLGRELTFGTLNANYSRRKLIQAAQNWFIINQKQVTERICSNVELQRLCQSEAVSTTIDVASLILVLIEDMEKSGAVVLIACLLAKQGIAHYCQVYWADESEKNR